MGLTFYHCPQTRSSMILWLLEEIGTPYTMHRVDIRGTHGKDDAGFRHASPFGKVPAINDDGAAINESAAIAIYLSDKYASGRLAPALSDPKRADFLRWCVFAAASLDAAIVDKMVKATVPVQARAPLDAVMGFIAETLRKQPYLTGETMTAADILIAAGLRFANFLKALPDEPVLTEYFSRMTATPASRRAFEIDQKLMADDA